MKDFSVNCIYLLYVVKFGAVIYEGFFCELYLFSNLFVCL